MSIACEWFKLKSKVVGCLAAFVCFFVFFPGVVPAQSSSPGSSKVLTLLGPKTGARDLSQDHGADGVWQRLVKLGTTASVLYTQAHPDDENADVITYLSRGQGARSALLSLNRGESGANILGPELFDQLGSLRTQEFLLAASYYGLEDLYFSNLVDYGFSKRVAETYLKWGKENILREMVRVIRLNRPLVIISRFHGTDRDGHGNHQAAGEMTPVAYRLAADSTAFPEQLSKEGLRPWKALKLYRGGVNAGNNEPWSIAINTGEFSTWLGQSYKNFSLVGYSMHRSQFGGQRNEVSGPSMVYYERLQSSVNNSNKESSVFDGIDTSLTGIFSVTGEKVPDGMMSLLEQIKAAVDTALTVFSMQDPAHVVPLLAGGLARTRSAIGLAKDQPEARFMLVIKERQFMDAINTALAISLSAIAEPAETKKKTGYFAPPVTMGFAVPGKPFTVNVLLHNNGKFPLRPGGVSLLSSGHWEISSSQPPIKILTQNQNLEQVFTVTVPEGALPSQPYYRRKSIFENAYQLQQASSENLAESPPDLRVMAAYFINNQRVDITVPVQVQQANLPFGYNFFTLKVAPALTVNLKPAFGIIPLHDATKAITMEAELVNNWDGPINGELRFGLPSGWHLHPVNNHFFFSKAGEKLRFPVQVTPVGATQNTYQITAVAVAHGKTYTEGSYRIHYRDLDDCIQYAPATTTVKGVDVDIVKRLRVGYVMGGGDEVPEALKQLGVSVQLLTAADLSAGHFNQFHAIVIGTRAYAVRPDLVTNNQSLLNFCKQGGHLLVLYQSPEFVPEIMAPFPATLPGNAEEVSEEDALVSILAPDHRVLNFPNKITAADFSDWVEQRGSKFFAGWDKAYQPIIESHDAGQRPQQGGWLMANYGKGYYTYFAYALQRQLPYGVPGAYRLLANLISYGQSGRAR